MSFNQRALFSWLVLTTMFLTVSGLHAVALLTEDFNSDGEVSRYTSSSYNNGLGDFFERTDSNPHPDHNAPGFSAITFSAPQDGGFWASEDVDGGSNPLGNHGIVWLNDLLTTGLTNLQVSAFFAQTDDRFDINYRSEVQYAIDGDNGGPNLAPGNYTTIGRFIGDAMDIFGDGDMKQDVNLDGLLADDGGPLTLNQTMTEYVFDVLVNGNSLLVQARIRQNGGTEELGFDHISVNGDPLDNAAVNWAAYP
jgi:hypothetical protein